VNYAPGTALTPDQIQSVLDRYNLPGEIQLVSGGEQVSIRTDALTASGDREALINDLASQAKISPEEINVEDVGPTWGQEISRKAIRGLLFVLLFIAIYIAWRFEWSMAAGAMIALVHDVVITAGIYALVGREVTPETVIAILTILGFSLYDTVVIYDKIKENTESAALTARLGYVGVVDMSLNQTVMRSVNTSLVVLLPILSLLLFGGQTLKDFAFAMFVGVAIGAYSSIFIAAPVLTIIHERQVNRGRVSQPTRTAREPAAQPAIAAADDAAATGATAAMASRPRPKPKSKPRNKKGQPAKRKRR
jgi:preprotein translocase subunit SecF